MTSDDKQCGTISIHPLVCQTNNCFKNTTIQWQTMSKLGVLTINAEDYSRDDGFFIKFTVHKGSNSI